MSQKVIYESNIIDPVINGFIPHEVRIHFHIFYYLIITFFINGLFLGFSDTYRVDTLYRFRKSVSYKVKTEVVIG